MGGEVGQRRVHLLHRHLAALPPRLVEQIGAVRASLGGRLRGITADWAAEFYLPRCRVSSLGPLARCRVGPASPCACLVREPDSWVIWAGTRLYQPRATRAQPTPAHSTELSIVHSSPAPVIRPPCRPGRRPPRCTTRRRSATSPSTSPSPASRSGSSTASGCRRTGGSASPASAPGSPRPSRPFPGTYTPRSSASSTKVTEFILPDRRRPSA